MISKPMLWRLAPLALLVAVGCVAPTANVPESGSKASRTTSKAQSTPTPAPQSTASATAEPTATPTASTTAEPTATPTASPTATPTASPTATPDDTASDTVTATGEVAFATGESYTVTLAAGGNAIGPNPGQDASFDNAVIGKNDNGMGMAVFPDEAGNVSIVYFTDPFHHMVREISNNKVQPVMDGRENGFLTSPRGLAYDHDRKVLYVADTGNRQIVRIGLTGNTVGIAVPGDSDIIAGLDTAEPPAAFRDGPGINGTSETAALFHTPVGLALSPLRDKLYVVDSGFHTIREIDLTSPNFEVSTLSGGKSTTPGTPGSLNEDIDPRDARYNNPSGLALGIVSGVPHLFVADTGNHVIRSINLNTGGKVKIHAGDLTAGSRDGAAGQSRFDTPIALAADLKGNVYVGEAENYRLRRINPDRRTVTLAGSTAAGSQNGTGNQARFGGITGMALHTTGTGDFVSLYIYDLGTDENPPRIRKIVKNP